MPSSRTLRAKFADQALQAILLGLLTTLAVLGAQAFTWLKYGVWPPGSPLAIWAYFDGLPLLQQEQGGRWVVISGWDLVYKYTIVQNMTGGWIGRQELLHWCLTTHIAFWVMGVGALLSLFFNDR